jgi:hypothetical protein
MMNQHKQYIEFSTQQDNSDNVHQFTDVSDYAGEHSATTQPEASSGNNEPSGAAPQETPNKRIGIKPWFDGTILVRENMVRQIPYVLFLTLLGVIYIGNRFHAESLVRKITVLTVEVENFRAEQITTTSELMNISRPSEVAALVELKGLGLKELLEPPKKLKRK